MKLISPPHGPRHYVQKQVAQLKKENMTNRELQDFDVSIEGKGFSLEQNEMTDRMVMEASKSCNEESRDNGRYSNRIRNHKQRFTKAAIHNRQDSKRAIANKYLVKSNRD